MKKIVFALFAFVLALFAMGTATYAWWNLNTHTEDEVIVIGTGAVLDVSLEEVTNGVLIPKGVALLDGQVNEIVFEYNIELEVPIIEGELFLEVWVDNVLFSGQENANLEQYLVFELFENPMVPSVSSYNRVMDELDQTPTIFIRVTLEMDENTPLSDVEEIKNSDIDFQITFKVSDTDPN